MRIAVVSDSHGDFFALEEVLLGQPSASLLLFLGDGAREFDDLCRKYPERRMLGVAGNCDFASGLPSEGLIEEAGVRIFFTHGHALGVKHTLDPLWARARRLGARVALFGHTHEPVTMYDDGVYLMNPGSIARPRAGGPSYGIIDITPAGIVTSVVHPR